MVKRKWLKPGAFIADPALMNFGEDMEDKSVRKVLDNYGLYEAWYEEVPKPTHNIIPLIGMKFMDMIHEGKMSKTSQKFAAERLRGVKMTKRLSCSPLAVCQSKMSLGELMFTAMQLNAALALNSIYGMSLFSNRLSPIRQVETQKRERCPIISKSKLKILSI